MKKLFVFSFIMLMLGLAFGARRALVIGNARYPEKPLKNPTNDAELMRETLEKLDFSVVKLTDINRQSFDKAVRDFAAKLEVADEVVFYYSGHGVQVNGENFLLPVGEQIEDESDVADKAINLNWITTKLSSTAITMIFLDACRDNPYSQYRSNVKGLAMAGATGANMFMMFSTEAGSVANDGKGANSDFTKSLSNQMQKPGLSLDDISTNVTAEVRETTDNAQRPWRGGSLSFKYFFIQPTDHNASRFPPYQESSRGRISSTVEERLRPAKKGSDIYNPKLSKYLKVQSANEILLEDMDDNSYTSGQFTSRNAFGMKIPYVGVEAFYNTVKTWQNSDFGSGVKLSQMGAGTGMPDPDLIRLFGFIVENDLSAFVPYESYLGFKGEFAKRVRSAKQFSELGCSFEYNQIPDHFDASEFSPLSSYFEADMLDWTPNVRFNAYLLASSLNNRYLEPNNFRGLGPANSPLLIANQQANAFIIKLNVEQHETAVTTDSLDTRNIVAEFMLPLNFGKVVALDIGYRWQRHENLDTESESSASTLNAGTRITFLPLENFRLIGSAEYNSLKADKKTETWVFGAHAVLKLTHHFAAIASFRHTSIWLRDQGLLKLDPEGFTFSSTLAVRL